MTNLRARLALLEARARVPLLPPLWIHLESEESMRFIPPEYQRDPAAEPEADRRARLAAHGGRSIALRMEVRR
ncbi:MAG: hypothetical protein GX442_14600 [Candidatus Riflebacteria bacterium]|nr:hypothetical protein [Candidatus Riflebacteria bacterium]